MIGLLLTAVSTFFSETQESLGKKGVTEGTQSIYTMGFLSMFWGCVLYAVLSIINHSFRFSFASLPTFGVRIILELILAHISVHAITRADRSTYSFIRVGTIPILLVTDIALGYSISTGAFIGIGLILVSLCSLFFSHTLKKNGAGLTVATMLLAVATLSLYKYDITHFNSVEAEQGIIVGILLLYFFFMARWVSKENPFRLFSQPSILGQSLSAGIADVLMSFAYLYGSASIITAAKRGLGVFWAILSGNRYFKEAGLAAKLFALLTIVAGLLLTTF